jgi:beta-galactosidase
MIRTSFDRDWYVRREGADDRGRVGPVTLPYDPMLYEERDPGTRHGGNTGFYPGGVYRYSKSFAVPGEWRDRSVTVEFEGVYHRSKIFVNGQLAGERPSGYALFHVTLDPYLDYGAENTIEVVADNSAEPNSRWYTGSGIYRPVHLLVGQRIRVSPTGIRVATALVTGTGEAGLAVKQYGTTKRAIYHPYAYSPSLTSLVS